MANSKRSLLVYMWLACMSILTKDLLAQPLANFKATPVQGCNPLKVDFVNSSTGAVSFTWAFGNGNSSTLAAPSAVYNTPGKFTVTLIARDINGLADTLVLTDFITVFRTPKADFSAVKQTLCSGDTAKFTDMSIPGDGPIKSFKWDFGNGGVSYLQNPIYVYSGYGSYDITFAITDTNGCSSSVKVAKYMQTNTLPTADFSAIRPSRCKSPATIKFSATAQGSGSFAYSWSFGDGGTGSGSKVDHMYNNLGAYPVTLNVTDGNGCTVKVQKPNYVQIKEPTVVFTASQTALCAGQKVGFQNQSFPTDGTGRFHWNFGNGDTASGVNPEVTFKNPGVYSVSLTYYWDGCSVTQTKTAYITVSAGVIASIQPRDTAICRERGASFALFTKGADYSKVIWDLGKGKTRETDQNGTFTFPLDTTNGTYTIKATLVSNSGCKSIVDSTTITIRGPQAIIGIDKTDGCIPFDINAYSASKSVAPITSYLWTGIGQPVSSTSKSVSFVNNVFGKSALQLDIVDANGCKDMALMLLAGGVPVESKFSIDKKIICSNETLTLFNHSKNQDPDTVVFLWSWTGKDTILFPPLATSTKVNFRHRQTKNAKLTFTANSFGCTSQSAVSLEILGAYLDGKVKVLCEADTLIATNSSEDYTSTFWKYTNSTNNRITDNRLNWSRKLSETDNIWLYAFNSANNCKDSMPMNLGIDPQDASFTYALDCGSGLIQAKNTYVGPNLHDTLFEWTITNTQDQSGFFFRGREFSYRIPAPGAYRLQLQVKNPEYKCTPLRVVTLNVKPLKNLRGTVGLDRTSCYPVNLTLRDDNYKSWKSAKWVIGGDVELKDDVLTQNYSYISNKPELNVYLLKTDSLGCSYTDTFKYQINGVKANMVVTQDNTDCLKPIVKFEASASPIKANTSYSFAWDFGHRKSTRYTDTVRMKSQGSITATLLVTESGGCKSQLTQTISVKVGKPVAKFITSDSLTACPPLNVSFIDASESGYGPITSRQWDFGDLTYSDKLNPGKLYVVPGKYTVSLIVTNTSNCKDTFSVSDLVVVKGPYGTYSVDKTSGCAPFKVNLNTVLKGSVSRFDFDMGDGNVIDKGVNSHNYKQPGVYIPRLILIDSAGCKYSPEPTDTIRVYPTPIAAFTSGPVCLNQIYKVPHTTICNDSVTVEWSDNNKKLAFTDTLALLLNSPGRMDISLKVVTEHNCADSITKPFFAFGIRPKVSVPKEEYCLGDDVKINDLTTSDTTIADKKIWIGGELLPNTNPWHYLASKRGKLPLNLEYTDAIGCRATFEKEVFIRVGDTAAPPAIDILRTSVLNDASTETKFKSSVEPDFKDYHLYMQDGNVWTRVTSNEDMQNTVLLSKGLDTRNKSYCYVISQRNFCGVESVLADLVKHCTIETKAVGDTNASLVNWSPYVGWNDVAAYRIWRKKRDEANYTLLNTVPGDVLSYIDTAVYCNVEYDFHIEGVENAGNNENSFSDTAGSKPIHFQVVPAPELWRTTVDNNQYVHTEWLMPVKPKYPVAYFSLIRNDGTPVPVEAGKTYYDDYQTDVQRETYMYTVVATDVCNTSSPKSNVGRNILLTAKSTNENQDPQLSWTPYIYWNEGVQDYRIERSLSGSEFQEIGRVGGTELTFTDHDLPKHCEKNYQYRVIATRNQPSSLDSSFSVESVSNHFQYTPEIRFFIPNAFTPNNNNLNEGFHPDGVYFSGYEMKIYNRYGQKIYENSDCMNSWDGKYMNEETPEGVYAYYVEARDVAGKSYKFNGTIHLLR
jgi:gliding motility-associated-like protein